VKVLREVTQDNHYASGAIAKMGWKMPDEDKKAIRKASLIQGQQKTNQQ